MKQTVNAKQLSPEDTAVLDEIKLILERKPTYGYRRVTAVLNAKRHKRGDTSVNHKRVYRLMKSASLLLAPYASKPLRVHEGKIVTLRSNTRWCSDTFFITCDNGQRVEVAFSLDTCDREAMRYVATNRGIDGQMIADLMAETMEYRFGKVDRLPRKIQWLSDNGPCYISRKAVKFGREIDLEICTTRPYSPESNGMAEAFVKTFKRDYVWLGDLSSASRVMEQLPEWFRQYNEEAPHKGLKMLTPRQFIKQQKQEVTELETRMAS